MVFLVGLIALGAFVYKTSGNRRFAAEKGEEIKIKNEELKIKDEKEVDTKLANYLLTPGPVKKNLNGKEIITSVNGRFVRFEEIAGSEDKYLVLDGPETPYNKLRVVAKPDKTQSRPYPTQVNVLLAQKTGSISSRLKSVGDFGKLGDDWVSFYFTPNVWLKGILYRDGAQVVSDGNGVYVLRAINVSEIKK